MPTFVERCIRVYRNKGARGFLSDTAAYLRSTTGLAFHVALSKLISVVSRRDNKLWVFTSRTAFSQNPKYLFLYVAHETDIQPVWVSKNRATVDDLRQHGYEASYAYSLGGFRKVLRAGYVFYSTDVTDVGFYGLVGGATTVNLWHGNPIKEFRISNWHTSLKRSADYHLVTSSDASMELFEEVPWTKNGDEFREEQALATGYPRNDILFGEVDGFELGLDMDVYEAVEDLSNQGPLYGYMPTFRPYPEENPLFDDENLKRLDGVLKELNANLVVKHHPSQEKPIDDSSFNRIHILPSEFDIYPVLRFFDVMITDYSSVYHGFLLLDRPIILFPYDLEKYRECHGFQYPYDEIAGPKPQSFDELVNWVRNTSDGKDGYEDERQRIKSEFYDDFNGRASERVVEELTV